ncbi:Protein CBG26900 [Caenorhabditis briggsae]|uniref:Protein CBG26900 n=1 Tax=Caenorhabditis briggsae TaxID=6238 RepID=B6IIA0_CAEBR|nr:Protein CBG26900 [Caenorhabditis briggsae]CAR99630.1 Protein CBG26900 [Caenorhabditis briggsae]
MTENPRISRWAWMFGEMLRERRVEDFLKHLDGYNEPPSSRFKTEPSNRTIGRQRVSNFIPFFIAPIRMLDKDPENPPADSESPKEPEQEQNRRGLYAQYLRGDLQSEEDSQGPSGENPVDDPLQNNEPELPNLKENAVSEPRQERIGTDSNWVANWPDGPPEPAAETVGRMQRIRKWFADFCKCCSVRTNSEETSMEMQNVAADPVTVSTLAKMADGLGNRRWTRMFRKRHVEDFLKHMNEYDGPTTRHSEATQSTLPSFPIFRRGFMVDEQQNRSSFFGGVRCFRQPQPPPPSTNNNPQIGTVKILNCFGDYWRLFTRRTPRQLENVSLQELEPEPQTNLTADFTDRKQPKIANDEHQPWIPSATEDPDAVREQETYL